MFNPLSKIIRNPANKKSRTASRCTARRLTFESVESRTMLSGTSTEVEATPVLVADDVQIISPVQLREGLHLEVGAKFVFRGVSFQHANGGFLSTNFLDRGSNFSFSAGTSSSFSPPLSSTINVESFTVLPAGNSGITLDPTPFSDPSAATNYNNTLNTVMSPIAIVGPDSAGSLNLPSGANASNKIVRSGEQGGAIRIEPILQPIASNNRGYILLPPAQNSALAFDSTHSMSPALSIPPVNTVSGELARAMVFEMAGGEPISRGVIDRDAKLHSAKEQGTEAADLVTALEPSGTLQTEFANGFTPTAAGGTAIPTSAAVAAAMNAFMLDWNWMEFAFPLSVPQAVDRPAVEANSDAAAPAVQERAAVRLPDENQRLASLEFAPVLVALALERAFSRSLDGPKEAKPKRRFFSRK